MKRLLICTVMIFGGTQAFAAAGMEPVGAVAKPTPTVDSIRDSSSDTKKSNQMGQVINLLSGAANIGMATQEMGECSSSNYYKCAMATLHFAMGAANFLQASAQNKTAKQAGGSFGLTDTGSDVANPGGAGGYDPSAVAKSEEVKKGKALIDSMSGTEIGPGKPFVYNPKAQTITTSKGNTYKLSDFSSPGAMAAAGMSKAVIDAAISSQKEIITEATKNAEKYKIAQGPSLEESGSGGGGWGSGSSAATASGDATGAGLGGAGKLGIDRDPAQLAGMQKNYNGEPIGVAGDSIFKMMTRRYKVKESQRSFYDESELLMQK
jgi:hypothetical protein